MRNLFLKIFLGFWLTVLLAGLLMWLLATLTRPDDQPVLEKHLRFVARGLDGYADDALKVLRDQGLAGWRAYQQSLPPDEPRPFILTAQLRPLADGPVPPMVVDLARRVLAEGRVEVLNRRRGFAIGRTLQLPNGQPAALVLHFRLPGREQVAPPPRWRSRWFDDGHPVGLFIFLLVSAGVCLLLTRSLTRPIGQLRRATQAFASGRLETRVGADLRGDRELVRLGQDFDRMAERIEALVTGQQRLLRDISHELRSPLARLGVALGLARQKAPEELIASLDRIERESERLNALIEELLTLARLEQQAERQRIDLVPLLAGVAVDAAFEAAPRGIRMETTLPESAATAGQPELLRRAVENILRNAVRHSPDNGTVFLSLAEEGGHWIISIRDQGPGVATEDLPHIFEPFYRAEQARTPGSGAGLGLAIAARAVQLHGGSIQAVNGASGGLEVTISIPRERDR